VETARILDPARDRYQSLALSSVWKLATVRQAKALIVGAGALGNEVAKNLVMMGVRLIVVVDRDTVEVANLTRSVFFRETDHGRAKTTVLAERLKELNSEVEVFPLNGDLEAVVGLGLLRRIDLVFSCLDNRLARRTLNRMCEKISKPWVDGSMENLLGDVTLFLPGNTACYECTLTSADKEIIAQAMSCKGVALQNLSQGKVPTVSTMGSIIAAIQVQEALKVLHNDSPGSLAGGRLVVNCANNDFYTTRAARKEDCEGHFRYGDITEVQEWRSVETSPRDILARFEKDTGQKGHLRLGREIVIKVRCAECPGEQLVGLPMHLMNQSHIICPTCGRERVMETTNRVQETDWYATVPLAQLGVPSLDVLEVRGPGVIRWYELTGDLNELPSALSAG
jgi:molybdopterin/thiamine biosynthesis adenylyltransferase